MAQDKRKRRGLLIHPDDLDVGRLVTIHHWRDGSRHWLGQGLRITAINLPFVVCRHPCGDPGCQPLTLDVRAVRLMPVSEEFVQAQASHPEGQASCPQATPAEGEDSCPF